MKTKTKFKETETGMIPEDWGIGKIADLVKVIGGFAIKSADFIDKGVPVIKIKNIQENGSVEVKDVDFISEESFQAQKDIYKLKSGDFVIAMTGATIGKIGKIPAIYREYMLNQRVARVISEVESNKQFIFQVFRSILVQTAIQNYATGAAQANISSFDIEKISIPLPPKNEREGISKILSDLDFKIELNQQMNKTLEAIGQAIFKRWFVDFEFPDEKGKPYKSNGGEMVASELGEIPKGWEIKEISDCGDVICGKTPPTKDQENYGEDIPFITIPDMRGQTFIVKTERKLSKQGANLQANKELPPLAICVSCIATPGLVSLTSEISHTNQQINSVACNENVSPYFMYYSMVDKSEQIRTMGLGGTATLNLNTGNFSKIKIIRPLDETMKDFDKLLKLIFNNILCNQKENLRLTEIRDSLLPRLMSGRIRVS